MQGLETKRPPFWLSLLVCTLLTIGFVYMRVSSDRNVGPALGLALLICLWNRERWILWIMTLIFTGAVFYRIYWKPPVEIITDNPTSQFWDKLLYLSFMLLNIWVIALVVHLFIGLHERLERRNATLEVANAYLESANKELSAREKQIHAQHDQIIAKEKQIESMSRQLESRPKE